MRRQGCRVYRTQTSYWYEAGPRVLQAFPYHWLISPSTDEIRSLLLNHGMVALRFSAPLNFSEGMASYHVILRRPYSLDTLKSQTRNGIKRGMRNFKVERISFGRLATEGWSLQQDTLKRQNRLGSMKQDEWECICRAADGLPGFEVWAGIKDGNLAGALLICRIDDVFNVPYSICHSRFLRDHINNAVFYVVSNEMLEREGIKSVFFTVQSLDASPTVDEFKFRMGFTPKAVRQCVMFHPLLKPLANPITHALTKKLLDCNPSNGLLAKAEGMLRFHVQGMRSLPAQSWPKCLEPYERKRSAPSFDA